MTVGGGFDLRAQIHGVGCVVAELNPLFGEAQRIFGRQSVEDPVRVEPVTFGTHLAADALCAKGVALIQSRVSLGLLPASLGLHEQNRRGVGFSRLKLAGDGRFLGRTLLPLCWRT